MKNKTELKNTEQPTKNLAKPAQPTKEDYTILIQLAQMASVPLAQSLTVLGIIQKIAQYHGVK